jgi:hypothetical protein
MADNDMNERIRRGRGRPLPAEEADQEPQVEPQPLPDLGAGPRPPLARRDGNRAVNAWIRQQHARSRLAPTTVNARVKR